jgi:hypothetical protein
MIGPVRQLFIRIAGRRMARHVQTIRSVPGSVIDVRTWSSSEDPEAARQPMPPMIEPDRGTRGRAT